MRSEVKGMYSSHAAGSIIVSCCVYLDRCVGVCMFVYIGGVSSE
jgi:hypothetical protein